MRKDIRGPLYAKRLTRLILAYAVVVLLATDVTASSKSLNPFQQSEMVSGKVRAESGELLPGVNVLLKGTNIGTVTDEDGHYSLSVTTQANLNFE